MARMSSIIDYGTIASRLRRSFSFDLFLPIIIVLLMCDGSSFQAREKWIKNELKNSIPSIFVDTWSGRKEAQRNNHTLIFVELSPADFVFEQKEEGFTANFHIDVTVWNRKKELVYEEIVEDSAFVETYRETRENNWNRLYRVKTHLSDGRYRARIQIVDNTTQKEAILEKSFEVRNDSPFRLDLSDILVAREDQVVTNGKLGYTILPFPPKVYGTEQSELYAYFEIYNRGEAALDSIEYIISYIDSRQTLKVLKKARVHCETGKLPILYSFDTRELSPGSYRLLVQVTPQKNGYQIEREDLFYVYQNPMDLRFRSYSEVLEELRLIAETQELSTLEGLPEQHRQEELYDFWKRRDPSPQTERNELEDEFYKRVNLARSLYPAPRKKAGKLSDQGKVYILMGAPDNIERLEENFNSSMEIWYYNHQPLKVVFKDEYGFGNFRLIAPSEMIGQM